MPVNRARVDDITSTISAIYREAETALLRQITDRLAVGLDATGWQTSRLAALQAMRRSAAATVNALHFTANTEIRRAIAASYRAGNHDAVRELSALLSPSTPLPDRIEGSAGQRSANAVQALADALVHELAPLHAAILPQAESAYRDAVAGASARKLAGAQTWREAAQGAWSDLVRQGITHYEDSAGRRWQLSTYVAMAVGTANQRAATAGLVDRFHAEGTRLVSVDDRPAECELCRPYEHQVLALWGPTGRQSIPTGPGEATVVDVLCSLDEARTAGLFHPNCRHTIRAYIPGVSMLIKQGRTADPVGADNRDRLRAMERTVRSWREREATALDPSAKAAAAAKIRQWDTAIAHHTTSTKTPRVHYREHIGAGIIPPAGVIDRRAAVLGIPTQPAFDI